MEILKSGDVPALVTNIEVLKILSENLEKRRETEELAHDEQTVQQQRQRRKTGKLQHRDYVEEKVYEYLQYTACANVDVNRMPELVSKLRSKPPGVTKTTVNGSSNETTKPSLSTQDNDETTAGDGIEINTPNKETGGFNLTDAETLQVLNLMPKEPVEIHLMVEDLPSRLNEDQQNDLLELIGQFASTGIDEVQQSEVGEEDEVVGEVDEEENDSGGGNDKSRTS